MPKSTRRKVAVVTNVGEVLDQARRRQHARRVAMIAVATGPITVNRLPGRPVTLEELSS